MAKSHEKKPAPSDAACEKAWKKIMGLAEAYGLITAAYGGVAVLALPEEQRRSGIREQVLQSHLLLEPK